MTLPGGSNREAIMRRVRARYRATVDIVIPFFNQGMFIEEAIASAQEQTYPPHRIIVVDDGSTDAHSIDILDRLESRGAVEVIRQHNQGPSAARNRGVEASSADAVLFLDGDDRLVPRHIEAAVSRLASADDTVGFAYPDQQCFGTVEDLAIMPPYNLYVLGIRNFAGTASLVDAAVFAAGHRFREDLRHGHEDWEFFLRLGLVGIQGVDFHGTPVQWRRWGYSRSDGINDRVGPYAVEVRKLHPEMFEAKRMVELKRTWSPGLSIVAFGRSADTFVSQRLVEQTCGDFEIVRMRGTGTPPRVRGRWVVVLDVGDTSTEAVSYLLEQGDFVERIIRVARETKDKESMVLVTGRLTRAVVRWQCIDAVESSEVLGVVVDGRTYDEWIAAGAPSPEETAGGSTASRMAGSLQGMMAGLVRQAERPPQWRWVGSEERRTPRPPSPPSRRRRACAPPEPLNSEIVPGLDPLEEATLAKVLRESFEQERRERWSAPPLFFPEGRAVVRSPNPPPGFVDGLDALASGAWRHWVPNQTCALDLVVDQGGRLLLEVVHDMAQGGAPLRRGGLRFTLGRLWTRKFPGTAALYGKIDLYTHRITYRVSDGPADEEREWRLGYVATEPLSDMLSLDDRVQQGVTVFEPIFDSLLPPLVQSPASGAFLEPAGPATAVTSQVPLRGRLAPWLYGAGGVGSTLYQVTLRENRTRYFVHPDACVAHPEVVRPIAAAVAELGPPTIGSTVSVLQETRDTGGGVAYVTGPVDPSDQTAGPILGAFNSNPATGRPLVRLSPGPGLEPPVGEPGHRLALEPAPLIAAGYIPDGVVGYAWAPDPNQRPLYCWDTADGCHRLLTLGEQPMNDRPWKFRGTFGLAWHPNTAREGLVDLWELHRGEEITYAIDPSEFEPMGFICHRVVARVPLRRRPGSIPLWRTSPIGEVRWRFTTCPDEGLTEGFVRQGMICFLDPAHPQPATDEGAKAETGRLGAPRLIVGPVSFGSPVYRVTDRPGARPRVTSILPSELDAVVEEVVGYLPPVRDMVAGRADAEPVVTKQIFVASDTLEGSRPAQEAAGDIIIKKLIRRSARRLPEPVQQVLRVLRSALREGN